MNFFRSAKLAPISCETGWEVHECGVAKKKTHCDWRRLSKISSFHLTPGGTSTSARNGVMPAILKAARSLIAVWLSLDE